MSNPYFSFKQFTVYHDRCAMKVGTDGVLLGAWADCSNTSRIVDVGTGSGLIALMLAQRTDAQIDALDIDKNACEQAEFNFHHSKFNQQLQIYHTNILNFKPTHSYDLVVSNPPYFINSLQSPDKSRSLARHSTHFDFSLFIHAVHGLLSDSGRLSLILPASTYESIEPIMKDKNLFLTRKAFVRPLENLPPKRLLLEYSKIKTETLISDFYIEKSRHNYSDAYKELTKEYYLNFP